MLRLTFPNGSVTEIAQAPDGTVSAAFKSVIIVGGESSMRVGDLFTFMSAAVRDRQAVITYASD